MDSFNRSSRLRYNPNSNTIIDLEGETEFSGILEIYAHHARDIHNICIYDNQDVYAKFSLTYNPDEILSTRVINGGGKNPEFNENLMIKVTQPDSVLKCEIWMFSRARNFMEDQLLGFALVPISLVFGKGKITQDFSLSSTDLFHSPAGTVRLSLSINTSYSSPNSSSSVTSSISSEVVLLDRKISEVILDPIEYSRIEFPDMNIASENQKMVSDYFGLEGGASFLHLGSSPQHVDDYEMAVNSSEENRGGSVSPNSGITDDNRTNSVDSIEQKNRLGVESSYTPSRETACPETPTSKKKVVEKKESGFPHNEEEVEKNGDNMGCVKYGQVLGNINLEAEQSAMQKQIVDMYTRSMQQFTESLAKMKLPIDHIGKPENEDRGEVIQNHANKVESAEKKKDGSRVFYGSRAFF